MDIVRTIVKANPTNAYFIAVQAVVVLTLAWIALVVAGVILVWGAPAPVAALFRSPAGTWVWFAGAGVLLGSYGALLAFILYRAATLDDSGPDLELPGR